MTQRIELHVPAGTSRTRLEDFLFDCFPNLSRMYLRDSVRDGRCEVNGRLENVGFRVRAGDFIEIELDPSRENAMRPADIPLDIVFEDDHVVVVNKPAGMLVHPTHRDKTGTLLNALAFHLNAKRMENAEWGMRNAEFVAKPKVDRSTSGLDTTKSAIRVPHSALEGFRVPQSPNIRPGLVHRLDRQTSGLIVVAKSVAVHRKLARQFQRKNVEKRYLALVDGRVERDEGVIEGAIGRYADRKHWDVKEDGKESITRFWVRDRNADSTLLELEPVTGRTNQLRIHCASIGHPITGDASRGGRAYPRLCLHAYKISFDHPAEGHRLTFEIDAPAEFRV